VSDREIELALSGLLPKREATLLATQLAHLPDPAAALAALRRLPRGTHPTDPARLHLFLVLAAYSPFLGDLLVHEPGFLDVLATGGPGAGPRTRDDLEEDLARFQALDSGSHLSAILRRFKQREYVRIALADFLATADFASITRSLSLLADVLLERAVRIARSGLEARFGAPTSRDDQGHLEEARFVVMALGKLGGEELNYSSDIDLIYLFSRDGETAGADATGRGSITNREFFTRLAREATRLIAGQEPEGQVFRVDLGLRPGGRDGDLIASVSAAVAYYRNWAEGWERQALIKARPAAGDLELGRRFVALVEPLIYASRPDPYLTLEIRAMKDRIDARISSEGRAETDIKLGRGGIREIEFAVQALQLEHGGRDPWLRQGNTLMALHRLADKGYLPYAEYSSLSRAYVFLRDLEHRLELGQDRQISTLPRDPRTLSILARRMGLGETSAGAEVAALDAELELHRRTVRAFYDSVVGRAAQQRIDEEAPDLWLDRMDEETLKETLATSGLAEPGSAVRPVKMIRRALQPAAGSPALRRALRKAGPALLQAAAGTRNPRRALDNLEKLITSVAVSPARLLRFVSRREILGPTIRLLARSDLLAGLVIRQPAILRSLENRARILRAPGADFYRRSLREAVRGPGAPRARAGRLRRRQQEALATIAIRDINAQATLRETLKSLSDLADATLDAVVTLARDELVERGQTPPEAVRLAILGLGRLGYRELDYGSDLDLVFLQAGGESEGSEGHAFLRRWCEGIVRILSTLTRDGQLYRVDLRLRPSGREGDLVASPGSLQEYFRRSADVWEMQSFLKARSVAGDSALGRRTIESIEALVLERAGGMGRPALAAAVEEMRVRLQKDAGRGPSIKLGAGGILEIHFVIEFLQLSCCVPGPDDKDTPRLLTHLRALGHLEEAHLRVLYEGYIFLRALEHELRLVHDPPLERLPDDGARLTELAAELDQAPTGDPRAPEGLLESLRARTAAVRRAYEAIVGRSINEPRS